MPLRPAPPPDHRLDRLVQRALAGTLLALAASLVAVAVRLAL
jgi:hypothetical protein